MDVGRNRHYSQVILGIAIGERFQALLKPSTCEALTSAAFYLGQYRLL
jgi:hypothetical protein